MPRFDPQDLAERLGIDAPHALAVVASSVGIYLAFLVLVRIFGQRVLSGMSTFDVVITVMLGSVAGRVVLGHPPTLAAGVLVLGTLFALEAAFGRVRSGVRGAHLVPDELLRGPPGD